MLESLILQKRPCSFPCQKTSVQRLCYRQVCSSAFKYFCAVAYVEWGNGYIQSRAKTLIQFQRKRKEKKRKRETCATISRELPDPTGPNMTLRALSGKARLSLRRMNLSSRDSLSFEGKHTDALRNETLPPGCVTWIFW